MSEKPIIFSGPMVRAILDGRKTMTRRIAKVPESYGILGYHFDRMVFNTALFTKKSEMHHKELRSPYAPGDHLWVRESFAVGPALIENFEGQYPNNPPVQYKADNGMAPRWRPSIHMPRWASRITLEITGVRVERLQDISEEDIEAEGVLACDEWQDYLATWESMQSDEVWIETPRQYWEKRWDRINGKKHPWDSNPWVIEFRKI